MNKLFLIFILFILISNEGNARRIGWDFSEYSFHYGGSSNFNEISLHSFEFTFDRGRTSCTRKPIYYGLGVSSLFGKEYKE